MASSGFSGNIKIWDMATGVATYSFEAHTSIDPQYPRSVFCVALSSDGRLLASGGMDGKVKVWGGSMSMPLIEAARSDESNASEHPGE